jgi:septal ring factor EnvC (AmiA/AmiB activator)
MLGDDTVVHDEDKLSYISTTDYRSMLKAMAPEIGQEHSSLIHGQQDLEDAIADERSRFDMTREQLLAEIGGLEQNIQGQHTALQRLEHLQQSAVAQRDHLQSTCQALQEQVGYFSPSLFVASANRSST